VTNGSALKACLAAVISCFPPRPAVSSTPFFAPRDKHAATTNVSRDVRVKIKKRGRKVSRRLAVDAFRGRIDTAARFNDADFRPFMKRIIRGRSSCLLNCFNLSGLRRERCEMSMEIRERKRTAVVLRRQGRYLKLDSRIKLFFARFNSIENLIRRSAGYYQRSNNRRRNAIPGCT